MSHINMQEQPKSSKKINNKDRILVMKIMYYENIIIIATSMMQSKPRHNPKYIQESNIRIFQPIEKNMDYSTNDGQEKEFQEKKKSIGLPHCLHQN